MDINYIHSAAEDVGLNAEHYDVITALRSWHWFNRNIVNRKVWDSLKTDGFLIVIHSIFVPRSKVAQKTINIIKEFVTDLKPAGAMAEVKERRTGLPINWFNEWTEAGFELVDEWEYDYQLEFTISEWCGKVGSLSWLTNEAEEVTQSIITKLQESFADYTSPLEIPHKYSVALLRKR